MHLYNMPEEDSPVLDWDRIVHKNVRSRDGQDAGNVDAVDADSIVIITEGARKEYKLPKSQVEAFNGAEVFLKSSIAELERFKV
ncbi:MAG: hypothetical protein ACJ71F_03620 [Nitrososphaeraceae archaeon]|jgi:hypothetical protein